MKNKILIHLIFVSSISFGQVSNPILANQNQSNTSKSYTSAIMETVPVIVILGQSNADSAPLNSTLSSEIINFYNTNYPNLKIYYKPAIRNNGIEASSLIDDGEWWTITAGHDAINKKTLMSIGEPNSTVAVQSGIRHAAELEIAKYWQENNAGKELRIIKFGIGATGLNDHWLNNNGNGDLYNVFMQYIYNPAVTDIIADGLTPHLLAVYWNQGENDTNNEDAPLYRQNLEQLISNFRTDSGIENAKFIIAQLSDFSNSTNWDLVKSAQATVAANDSNVDLIITDGSGANPAFDRNVTDGVHYTSLGQSQLGLAVWDIISKALTVDNISDSKMGIKIFPNPTEAMHTISINVEEPDFYDAIIYNIKGQVVDKQTLEFKTNIKEFQIKRLNSGIYILKLTNKLHQTYSKKIIID